MPAICPKDLKAGIDAKIENAVDEEEAEEIARRKLKEDPAYYSTKKAIGIPLEKVRKKTI